MRRLQKTVIRIGCALLFALCSPALMANTLVGIWEGTYECQNKLKPFVLEITDEFNARLDFLESADDETIKASEWMEVWHRDEEIHLIGSEWIVKPNGWVLSTLRLFKDDAQTLEGTYMHRGCGAVELKRSEARAAEKEAALKAQQLVPDNDFYLTSQYECKGKISGSYWDFTRTETGYSINVSVRPRLSPTSLRVSSIDTRKAGAGLGGFDASGRFGVQLDYSEESEFPVGYWTNRNGVRDDTCLPILFSAAVAPEEYWDTFFESAKNPTPSIDDIDAMTERYRTLPDTKSLSVANAGSYAKERDRVWKLFTQNYAESLPAQIKAIPLESVEDRAKARIQLARMEQPGFKIKADISALYANALFQNDVPIEPIHFINEQAACDRANSYTIPNSLQGVESFVGLSGFDWTESTTPQFVKYLEGCVTKELVDPVLVATAVERFDTWGKSLKAKSDLAQKLKGAANALVSQPKSFKTFVASKGYSTPVPHARKMDADTFNRFFEHSVSPARVQAMDAAMSEIENLFEHARARESGVKLFEACKQPLGSLYGKVPEYKAQLYGHCVQKSRLHLSEFFKAQILTMESLDLNEANVHGYMKVNRDASMENLVSLTELQNEYAQYTAQRKALSSRALETYLTSHETLYEKNTEQADLQIKQGCKQYYFNHAINSACRSMQNKIKVRHAQNLCSRAVEQADLSKKLFDNSVVYGDGVQQQEITLRDLVCETSRRGIKLKIDEKRNLLNVAGIDISSENTLFKATMAPVDGVSDGWFVDSLGGGLANTKFGDIGHSQLVQCLVSNRRC